jgi:hypothetical protein
MDLGAADTGMVLPIGCVLLDGMGSVGLGELPSEDRVVPDRSDGDLCARTRSTENMFGVDALVPQCDLFCDSSICSGEVPRRIGSGCSLRFGCAAFCMLNPG